MSTQTDSAARIAFQLGLLKDTDENFRTFALWLARDPVYGAVPISRLPALGSWLKHRRLIVATVDARIVGALAWSFLEPESAVRAIHRRVLPTDSLVSKSDALLITMIAGSEPGVVKRLMRQFIAMNRGRLLIFERHRSRGQASKRFGWVDREGVLGGAALQLSQR